MQEALALKRIVDLVTPNRRISMMLITGLALKINMMLIMGLALKINMMLITGLALEISVHLLALLGGSWPVDGNVIVGRGAIRLNFSHAPFFLR